MTRMPLKSLIATLVCLAGFAAAAPRQPNVVFIISDDHGWRDYGFMGHADVRTPHIDRLAKEGLTLTRGYVPTSLCRPSLASIMTGLYPHQHKITGNDPKGDAKDAANREQMVKVFQESKTIAGMLGAKGYVSHQSGKWWEGECRCGGFTECMTHGDVSRGGRHGDEGLKIGRQTMQPVFDFIDQSKGKPFFLWYAPFLPHTPHNPPERLLAKYRRPGLDLSISKYYAMIEWLDETVGQLREHLEKRGLADDTIIAYMADNGWVQLPGGGTLAESRAKLSPYDAGVRTPLILWAPKQIRPARDDRSLASTVDLATTILPMCDIKPRDEMPGINLLDARARSRRDSIFGAIFVHTSEDIRRPEANVKYRWMIRGSQKLIVPHGANERLLIWENTPKVPWMLGRTELFDLAADPGETRDLAGERPETVRSLLAVLDRWWNPARP